jgi:hypothetical protein
MTPSEIAKHINADLLRVSHDVLIADVIQVFGVSRQTALCAIAHAVNRRG